jgi:hypothetical protein
MRCEQFEERLHRRLDRREDPGEDAHLVRHARRCPECRETLAACARMIDGLNLLELSVPDDDFSLRVLHRTSVGKPSPAHRHRFRIAWAAVGTAVALSLLISVAWRADRTESSPVPASLTAAVPLADDSRLGADIASLTNRTPQHGPGFSASLALGQQPPLSLLLRWKETWGDATWSPVDGLADGLNPITVPLSVAVEEIRRTIPLSLIDQPPAPSADSVRREVRSDKPPVA